MDNTLNKCLFLGVLGEETFLETFAILALATSFVAAASFGVFLVFLATISDHKGFLDDFGVLVESFIELRGVVEMAFLTCGVLVA